MLTHFPLKTGFGRSLGTCFHTAQKRPDEPPSSLREKWKDTGKSSVLTRPEAFSEWSRQPASSGPHCQETMT
ncbi:hypothetical protein EYF80_015967 [Liparis tanakae]|uniref:Uncharacterized protein n=1 Tax=Liparis tanakae TaxID=230148 RepID=A0A4Z2I6S1_9TELE|nr:hypothetical protein EYF80_015967 [Liparis tanakae]